MPGIWTVESNAGDMGNAHRWLASALFSDRPNPYHDMSEAAQSVPPGSGGVSARLGPQAMNLSAVGMRTGGLTFPVPMTLGGPTKGQIARAALESFAYALRANVEQAEGVAGFSVERLALGGGMARSPVFTRIAADVLGREISLPSTPDVAAVGAALIARTAVGRFPSLSRAVSDHAQQEIILKPDPQNSAEYQDLYHSWLGSGPILDGMSI